MSEICTNIKTIIAAKGLKQKYVAAAMGIPPGKLSDIINGRKVIDPPLILSLCNALDVTPNELLGFVRTA